MWNSKNKMISSCVGLSLALMMGCGLTPFQDDEDDKGSISFAVQFPEKGKFQTQLIKPETVKLFAAVYGEDLPFSDPLISSPITKPGSESNSIARKNLKEVPTGPQTVLVAAYDRENKILTAGRAETSVVGDTTTTVEIELFENFSRNLTSEEVKLLEDIPKDDPVKEKEVKTETKTDSTPQTQPNTNQSNSETKTETKTDSTPQTQPNTNQNKTTTEDKKEEKKEETTEKEKDTPSTPQPTGFSLVHPSGNLSVSSNSQVTLATSVLDSSITQVEFYAGNQKLGTVSSAPFDFSWQTNGFNDGEHEVKAVAKDANGQIVATSDSRTVTIRRTTTTATPPSVPPPPAATPTPTPSPSPSINADITVNDGSAGAPGAPGAF